MPRASFSRAARTTEVGFFAALAQKIARRGGDVYPLHVGDSHLVPPDHIQQVARELDTQSLRYGPPAGLAELRSAIAEKVKLRNDCAWVTEAHVFIASGATHALHMGQLSILDPGDEVLVVTPCWPLLPGMVRMCGALPVEVPITQRLYADPGLDVGAELRRRLTDRTAAVYICSPNNPDGKVLSRAHLAQIAAVAQEHDLWVVSDEVYEDYVYGVPHVSIASLPGMASRTLTSFSLSKSHAMAGLRLGYMIAPEEAVAHARKFSNHSIYTPPLHLQRVARRALTADDFVEEARRDALAARDFVAGALRARSFLPEGGCFLLLDLAARCPRGAPDCGALLDRALAAGVALAPGAMFGAGFERHARLCFTALPRDQLRPAIALLNEVLDQFPELSDQR